MANMPTPTPESILFSVAECAKSEAALNTIKMIIKKSGAKKIFMDNGMFTFFQKWQNYNKNESKEFLMMNENLPVYPKGVGMNLTSRHVAYYASILKPHVTFCPDIPVPALPVRHDPGQEELNFRLTVYNNILSAREMIDFKPEYFPEVNLYFVFQGYNINQLIRLKRNLSGLNFDGWAIPTRAHSWNKLVAIMIMLYHWGVRKVHILAGSNLSSIIVGAFFAHHFFDEVSYDSTNWLQYGKYNMIRLFGSLKGIKTSSIETVPEDLLSYFCCCPHCNGRSIRDYVNIPYSNSKTKKLMKHNYFIEVEFAKALALFSGNMNNLFNFLWQHSNRKDMLKNMYECFSSILFLKGNLNNFSFANGFAESLAKAY